MALSDFVAELNALQAKAKKGTLTPDERSQYDREREELAQMLLGAQKVSLKPGEQARRALRVPRALPIELSLDGKTSKALTFELSALGFSAMVAGGPAKWQGAVTFKLKLPGAIEVTGGAAVVLAGGMSQSGRVGFAITKISDEDREAIAMAVFDDVLEKLGKSAARK